LESSINTVKEDPRAAAVRLHELDAEINALKQQLRDQTIAAEAREKELEKELASQRDKITESGLNRRQLLSNEYHKKKPWVSRHFFGLPWEEHKERGMAMFYGFVDNFNCNVTGEDDHIQPFEKYCICCMVAWRGFNQETIGYLYGRDQASISRYETDCMPLLGAAGADMSELDLVMNHNYFDMDYCKANGLVYMENGVAYKDGAPYNEDDE
jgi:hypothetical protein